MLVTYFTYCTVMVVEFKDISDSTFTIIIPYYVGTVVGTSSIVSETLISIYNKNQSSYM